MQPKKPSINNTLNKSSIEAEKYLAWAVQPRVLFGLSIPEENIPLSRTGRGSNHRRLDCPQMGHLLQPGPMEKSARDGRSAQRDKAARYLAAS